MWLLRQGHKNVMFFDFVLLVCSFLEFHHHAVRNTKQPHGGSQSLYPQITCYLSGEKLKKKNYTVEKLF